MFVRTLYFFNFLFLDIWLKKVRKRKLDLILWKEKKNVCWAWAGPITGPVLQSLFLRVHIYQVPPTNHVTPMWYYLIFLLIKLVRIYLERGSKKLKTWKNGNAQEKKSTKIDGVKIFPKNTEIIIHGRR